MNILTSKIISKFQNPKRRFVWIERHLSKNQYEKIKSLKFYGILFVEEFKRVYPNDELFSSILGFVGSDSQGLEGIELFYDRYLHGNKKKLTVRRDARGRSLLLDGMLLELHQIQVILK